MYSNLVQPSNVFPTYFTLEKSQPPRFTLVKEEQFLKVLSKLVQYLVQFIPLRSIDFIEPQLLNKESPL